MTEPRVSTPELDALFAAIGEVAFCWATLEYRVNTQIWSLAAVSERDGACLTAQIPAFISRMRALIALVRDRGCSDQLIKSLNAFTRDADEVSRRRNRVIHDPWYFKRGSWDPARLEITADRKLVFEYRPQSVEEIRQIARDITNCVTTFGRLLPALILRSPSFGKLSLQNLVN